MPLVEIPAEGRSAMLRNGALYGRLLDNIANRDRQGSGFNPLCHSEYAGKPIYITGATGLNFEHIYNGVARDNHRAMFTPRKDPVVLEAMSQASASLVWPAEASSWGMACRMTYTLSAPDAIDMQFEMRPTRDEFHMGYAAMMWASYMACARDRRIHFWGREGDREGWVVFGEEGPQGPEMGAVAYADSPPLPHDPDAQALNITQHPEKTFLKPFYFGLIDGDHDPTTEDDTLAYVMMFDRPESTRFAMWNFIKDENGNPDPRHPAWDWHFVVRDPVPGQVYSYRARLIIRPFAGPEEVLRWYLEWAKSLEE